MNASTENSVAERTLGTFETLALAVLLLQQRRDHLRNVLPVLKKYERNELTRIDRALVAHETALALRALHILEDTQP